MGCIFGFWLEFIVRIRIGLVLVEAFCDRSLNISKCSVDSRFMFLDLRRRSTQSIMQFGCAAAHRRVCQRNSFHLSNLSMWATETEVILTVSFTGVHRAKWGFDQFTSSERAAQRTDLGLMPEWGGTNAVSSSYFMKKRVVVSQHERNVCREFKRWENVNL